MRIAKVEQRDLATVSGGSAMNDGSHGLMTWEYLRLIGVPDPPPRTEPVARHDAVAVVGVERGDVREEEQFCCA
jgi:hypothetical protein